MPPGLIWKESEKNNSVYLTFDDGPTPKLTDQIMDILDSFGAKATFFCVGENVSRHPEVYHRILSRGHGVGNHTNKHLKGWDTPPEDYFTDVKEAASVIDSGLFRPPYGRITRSQVKMIGREFRIVMWSLLSRDFDGRIDPERNLSVLKKKTRPGSIVVFHDNLKAESNMKKMLPGYLEFLEKKGYCLSMIPGAGSLASQRISQ